MSCRVVSCCDVMYSTAFSIFSEKYAALQGGNVLQRLGFDAAHVNRPILRIRQPSAPEARV